jgi:hypothetical protein
VPDQPAKSIFPLHQLDQRSTDLWKVSYVVGEELLMTIFVISSNPNFSFEFW